MFFNPKYITVSRAKLYSMLPRELVESGKVLPYLKEYRLPLDPSYIMKKSPAYKLILNPKDSEATNCVQRVRLFKGWLVKKGLGNLVGFEAVMDIPGIGEHNDVAFIDLSGPQDENGKYQLVFGNLQTRKLVPKSESDKFNIWNKGLRG